MRNATQHVGDGTNDRSLDSSHHVGKRTLTSSLVVQRRAAAPAPATHPEPVGSGHDRRTSGPIDDPFSFGTVVQARGGRVDGEGAAAIATAEQGVSGASSSLPFASQIQQSFGRHDIGDVRAQLGGAGADASAALGATAYAIGDRVAFAGAPDLHTAAHEAAHVIQQRAGVHMKDGVGATGDIYERHADAVADLVVQGRSAEALLDQHTGSGAGGVQRAVQRASDYDGLLPAHETYNQSYAFNGGRSSEFTYHHIIPENRLKEVTTELKAIKKFMAELVPSEGNLELRNKGATMNGAVDGLIGDAKVVWRNTRIKNVTHELNHTYDIFGVEVSEDEVRNLIVNTAEDLALLFQAFEPLIKGKIRTRHSRANQGARRAIVETINDPHIYNAVNSGDAGAVADGLREHLDQKIFDRVYIETQVAAVLVQLRADQRHGQLNKSTIASALEAKLRERAFDAFYQTECVKVYQNNTSTDQHLKKILQQNALPHDDSNHLAHAVQWNPGNIHRGPSSSKRLNPDDEGFIENLDDGGNTFETAAFNVTTPAHFTKLNELKTAIDTLLATKVTPQLPPDGPKIDQATVVVTKMKQLMTYGLTGFREDQWQQVGGQEKMRLKLNGSRETSARDNGHIA